MRARILDKELQRRESVHGCCVRDLTILVSPLRIVVDGHDSADFISLRVSRRAANNIATIALLGGLAIAGFSSAVGERSHKGDRLQVASKPTSTLQSTVVVTTLSPPPIGCEPVFSGLIDPKHSHIFGRCIS
jgi:hypothetical protein